MPQTETLTSLRLSVDFRGCNQMPEAQCQGTETRSRKVVGSNLVPAEEFYHRDPIKYHFCYCPLLLYNIYVIDICRIQIIVNVADLHWMF